MKEIMLCMSKLSTLTMYTLLIPYSPNVNFKTNSNRDYYLIDLVYRLDYIARGQILK